MIKMAAPYFYPLSRLLSVRAQDANETFQYDQAGNLVSVGSGQTASYEGRAKGDRLQVFVTPEFHVKQSPQYSYDGHGNRIARSVAAQTEHYRYDGTHQLASIEHANGAKSRYEYDALGRRIAKHVTDARGNTQTTLFVWNGDWMVQELRAGSAPITYVQHPDNAGPLAKIEGGRVYHYVNDHLGTPQEIHDGRGQIVWAADTSAYGKTRNYLRREIDNPIRFPGQYYDAESGLHYNRYRYYDPMAARYINQDPIGLKGGMNQYAYVASNPLTRIDPLGLQVYDFGYQKPDGPTDPSYFPQVFGGRCEAAINVQIGPWNWKAGASANSFVGGPSTNTYAKHTTEWKHFGLKVEASASCGIAIKQAAANESQGEDAMLSEEAGKRGVFQVLPTTTVDGSKSLPEAYLGIGKSVSLGKTF